MEPKEKAALLPEKPGVYLFRDAGGTVIYVGKARLLRNRVRSYFLESRWMDAKTGSLAREIAELETIVVENEREALALARMGRCILGRIFRPAWHGGFCTLYTKDFWCRRARWI
jgi:excinuclease UvrABC nuclease subunit